MAESKGADLRERVTQLAAGYTRSQKMAAAAAVVVVLVGMLVMSRFVGRASYEAAFTDLQASDAAAITQELDKQNIPYQLGEGGTAIMVPSGQVYDARLKVSGAGISTDAKVGYGVLDDQSLTTSEFGQRVGFQRAMEGELATTIEALDVVDTATVHLALPDDGAFALDEQKATASVLIRTVPGQDMTDDQVQAVVNLVASGIKDLSPDDVTVADSDGNVLAAPGQGISATAGGGSGGARQKQTQQFEKSVAASIQAMLADVVGPDASRVTVSAELDFDESNVSRETFEQPTPATAGAPPIALEESTKNETYSGGAPGTSGVLGPDTPSTVTGTSGSDYSLDEGDVRYAVNRVVESTNNAPGAIERMSVAVAVDAKKVPAGVTNQLTSLVEAGAGIQSARGDTLALTRIPFDTTAAEQARKELEAADEAAAAEASREQIQAIALAVFLGIVLLVAFLLYRRSAKQRRRRAELLAELQREAALLPAPATEGQGGGYAAPAMAAAALVRDGAGADAIDLTGAPAGALGGAGTAVLSAPAARVAELPMGELSPEDEQRLVRQAQISQLVDGQPDEVAQMMRGWLGERRGGHR